MYAVLFLGIFVDISAWDINYYDANKDDDGFKCLREREVRYQYTRCTRRFSPGACHTPMRPVWTFAFSQQNCTERLGCPRDRRANRFMSYSHCMTQCQGLIDLYTHILASGNNNGTALRTGANYSSGRRGDDISDIEDKEESYYSENGVTLESSDLTETERPENMELEILQNVDNHVQYV